MDSVVGDSGRRRLAMDHGNMTMIIEGDEFLYSCKEKRWLI